MNRSKPESCQPGIVLTFPARPRAVEADELRVLAQRQAKFEVLKREVIEFQNMVREIGEELEAEAADIRARILAGAEVR
jgi:hypothetical protein